MNELYLFLLLIVYIFVIVLIVRKTEKKTGKILYIIAATLIVSVLSNVPVWNFMSKSKSAEEAFGKSWHKGEIVNCIENDEIAVIAVLESQQRHYYTYRKNNDTYYELKNKPRGVKTVVWSYEPAGELIMIPKYDCPESDYVYTEVQIFCAEPENNMTVTDQDNVQLPYYTTIYNGDGYTVYTVYSYYSLIPKEMENEYKISVNGKTYQTDTQ